MLPPTSTPSVTSSPLHKLQALIFSLAAASNAQHPASPTTRLPSSQPVLLLSHCLTILLLLRCSRYPLTVLQTQPSSRSSQRLPAIPSLPWVGMESLAQASSTPSLLPPERPGAASHICIFMPGVEQERNEDFTEHLLCAGHCYEGHHRECSQQTMTWCCLIFTRKETEASGEENFRTSELRVFFD